MARKSFFSTPRTKGKPKADVQQSSEELEEAAETTGSVVAASPGEALPAAGTSTGPRGEVAETGDGDGNGEVGGNAQTSDPTTQFTIDHRERFARSSKWNPFS